MGLLAAGIGLCLAGGCSKGLHTGEPAPDFTLEDLFGNEVSLSQQRGNVVLLSFFAVG